MGCDYAYLGILGTTRPARGAGAVMGIGVQVPSFTLPLIRAVGWILAGAEKRFADQRHASPN